MTYRGERTVQFRWTGTPIRDGAGFDAAPGSDYLRPGMGTGANTILWTVGHSTRTIEAFFELLAGFEVALLVDVRTVPRSRHNPQFNTDSLPVALGPAGIGYRHVPDLGGLRKPRKDSYTSQPRLSRSIQ